MISTAGDHGQVTSQYSVRAVRLARKPPEPGALLGGGGAQGSLMVEVPASICTGKERVNVIEVMNISSNAVRRSTFGSWGYLPPAGAAFAGAAWLGHRCPISALADHPLPARLDPLTNARWRLLQPVPTAR